MGLLDVLSRLDPQARAALEAEERVAKETLARLGIVDVDPFDVSTVRALYSANRAYWNTDAPEMAESLDFSIPGPHGDVPLRLHRPIEGQKGPQPVIVFFHGGGWIIGDMDTHNRIMRLLAQKTGYPILGVDYRLAPEHPFPIGHEDCLAAINWVLSDGAALGLDAHRIMLAGDSAGASLSMYILLAMKSAGTLSAVQGSLLYYGVYGLRDSTSRRLWGGKEDGLGEKDIEFLCQCLFGQPQIITDPRFNVLACNLSGLPPLFIRSIEMDPLVDDSVALAAAANEVGVSVDYAMVTGVLHGFLHTSRSVDKAMQALDEGAEFLQACCSA